MVRPLSNINLALNRLDGAGNGVFSPEDIANLTCWWDPDDASTVTLSGSNVTALTAKVGSAKETLGQRGSEAHLTTGVERGRTWLNAEGGDKMLDTTEADGTALSPGTGEFSIYIVVRPNYVGTGTTYAMFGKGFTGWYGLRTSTGTSSNVVGYMDENGGAAFRTAQSAANVITKGGRHIIRLVRDNTANLMRVYVDGTQVASADITGMGSCDDAAEQFVLGARASGASFDNPYDGLIGEVLFYKDVLSAGDNTNLETYLADKWSTVGSTEFEPQDIRSLSFNLDPSLETDPDETAVDITDLIGSVIMSTNQSSNAGIPVLDTVDGLKWMRFDGAEQLQNTSAIAAGINFGSNPFAIAMVVRPTSTSIGRMRLINKGSNTQGRYAIDINDTAASDVRSFLHDGTNQDIALSATGQFSANAQFVIWLVRHNEDGNLYVYVNDTLKDTEVLNVGDIDETGTNPNFHYLGLGAGPNATTTATAFFDGYIGEVLFFQNTELSDNVRGIVDAWLAAKWGV